MHQRGIRLGSFGRITERETCTANRALMNYAFPLTTKPLSESYFSTTKLDHAWLRVENHFILILNNHGSTFKISSITPPVQRPKLVDARFEGRRMCVGCFLSISVGRIRL